MCVCVWIRLIYNIADFDFFYFFTSSFHPIHMMFTLHFIKLDQSENLMAQSNKIPKRNIYLFIDNNGKEKQINTSYSGKERKRGESERKKKFTIIHFHCFLNHISTHASTA